jgi:hypothetical protein
MLCRGVVKSDKVKDGRLLEAEVTNKRPTFAGRANGARANSQSRIQGPELMPVMLALS